MCTTTANNKPITMRTTLAHRTLQIAVILFVFCMAECAAGSCISYGHSCWGAHGKRSDAPMFGRLTTRDLPTDTRWFLTRLLAAQQQAFDRRQQAQQVKSGGDPTDSWSDYSMMDDDAPKFDGGDPNERLRILKLLPGKSGVDAAAVVD